MVSTFDQISIRGVFRQFGAKIIGTYFLFNIENCLRLLQPMLLGLAINDLLVGSYRGLTLFGLQYVAYMSIATGRRFYDTRAFTQIYNDIVVKVLGEQNNSATTRKAAHSTLTRNFVQFFEEGLPLLMKSTYSWLGALVLLGFYDLNLVWFCLLLTLPCSWINLMYSRRTKRLSRGLHDKMEQEVDVIHHAAPHKTKRHFEHLRFWRVQISDAGAKNFAAMEGFIFATMVLVLVYYCAKPGVQAGSILAVFRYVTVFITGLDAVPRLVLQLAQLRDISQRITASHKSTKREKLCVTPS